MRLAVAEQTTVLAPPQPGGHRLDAKGSRLPQGNPSVVTVVWT